MNNTFKIFNINNAFLRIEYMDKVILTDPWLTDRIFDNSWMTYPPIFDIDKIIKDTSDVLISHIHQDHCDYNLIKHLKKSVNFYIPEIFPNQKIKKNLNSMGYENVFLVKPKEYISIDKDLNLYVIPPMNEFGQETKDMQNIDTKGVPIDAGFLLRNENNKICMMADNSPYYFDNHPDVIDELSNSDIVMLPYNGYASDFPLNFINFSREERSEMSDQQSTKRMHLQSKFLKKINAKNTLMYSSEFALAGPMAYEFFTIHPKKWLDKKLAAIEYEKHTNIQTHYLYNEDEMQIDSNSNVSILRNNYQIPDSMDFAKSIYSEIPNTRYLFEKIKSIEVLKNTFHSASENLFDKMKLIGINSKSKLLINITDLEKKFYIDFENGELKEGVDRDANMKLHIESNYLNALFNFNAHWDDAQISGNLLWEKYGDYDPTFDALINFFHVKLSGPPRIKL
mgnify:FL=1